MAQENINLIGNLGGAGKASLIQSLGIPKFPKATQEVAKTEIPGDQTNFSDEVSEEAKTPPASGIDSLTKQLAALGKQDSKPETADGLAQLKKEGFSPGMGGGGVFGSGGIQGGFPQGMQPAGVFGANPALKYGV